MILQKIKKKFFKIIYSQPKRINVQDRAHNCNNHKNNNNKNNKKKKFRIKIITAYDKKFKTIGEFCSKSLKKYAKKYNYNFKSYTIPSSEQRPQSWFKIKLIQSILNNKNYDFVLWIDADAFFLRYDTNILNYINKKKDIYLVAHYVNVHKGSRFQNTKLTIKRENCGVMLIKNSKFSKDLLKKVWEKEEYINHPWWENAAVLDLFGHRAEINGNLDDHKDNIDITKRVKLLSYDWNCIPSFNENEIKLDTYNPIIIHMAGMTINERLNFIKNYIKKIN
jgi:hypothetical protein